MPKVKIAITEQEVDKLVALIESRAIQQKTRNVTFKHEELYEVLADENCNRIRWQIQPEYLSVRNIDSSFGSDGYSFALPAEFDVNSEIPEDSKEPFTKKVKKGNVKETFTKFTTHYHAPSIFADVRDAISIGMQPYVSGPPGSGKSRLFEEIALVKGQYCIRQSLAHITDREDLIGAPAVQEKNGVSITAFVMGLIPTAAREGWFVIFDELDRMSPEANMAFQKITEDGGRMVIQTDKGPEIIDKHPDFRMAFTGNTSCHGDATGLFPGAEEQDAAFLSRIGPKFELGYDHDIEKRVIAPLLPKQVLSDLYDDSTSENKKGVVRLLRDACDTSKGQGSINYQLSFRFMIRFAECFHMYGWNKAALYCLMNEFPEEFRGAVSDIITRRLGPEYKPTNDMAFIKANEQHLKDNGYMGKVKS